MHLFFSNQGPSKHKSERCCRARRYVARATFGLVVLALVQVPFMGQVGLPPRQNNTGENAPLTPSQKAGKWGYINRGGTFVIPPQFDSAEPFSEGLAAVELNHKFGYIDSVGHLVIQTRYVIASPFNEGLALVCTRKPSAPLGIGEYGVLLFAYYTYIDRSGREIMQPFSAESISNFSEGLAAAKPGAISGGCGKGGYLNIHGDWAIRPQYDDLRDFSEGLAAVNQGAKCGMGGKWGYVDKDGKLIVPLRFDFAGQFGNGRACVEENGKWRRIDKNGNGEIVEKESCLR